MRFLRFFKPAKLTPEEKKEANDNAIYILIATFLFMVIGTLSKCCAS